MYVVKFGDRYLTSTGDLSDRQSDALRVDVPTVTGVFVRAVHLRPFGSVSTSDVVADSPAVLVPVDDPIGSLDLDSRD